MTSGDSAATGRDPRPAADDSGTPEAEGSSAFAATANSWLERFLRPVAVAAMLTCIAISLGQFIRTVVPTWPAQVFGVMAFIVSLEAIYSQRLLTRRDLGSRDVLRFRFVEWVVILLFVRFAVYLEYGYERLLADLAAWSLNVGAMFDVGYIINSLLMLLFWLLAGMITRSMTELEASPIERMPSVTDPNHYLRATMPHHGRVDRGLRLRRITTIFWVGGVFMLIMAGLTRVEVRELIVFQHSRSSGVILNVLAYFVLGLLIISQAHYTILRANWDLQDIPIVGKVGKRWLLLTLGFLLALGLISALLPVSYSVGILQVAGTVFRWIIYMVVQIVFLILFVISYALGLILNLFSGGEAPTARPTPRTIAPPPPPPEAAADPNPWWAVVRSLIFWTILLGVVGYSFIHYAQDRWGLFSGLSAKRFLAWLRTFWRRMSRSARRAGRALQERIRQGLAARTRARPERRGFLSLRRLSPRDKVRYFYLSILHRSASAGFGRHVDQTPLEYERVLLEQLPDAADEVHTLTQEFLEARYSEHDVNLDRAQRAQTVWQRIKRLLALRRRASRQANSPSDADAGGSSA